MTLCILHGISNCGVRNCPPDLNPSDEAAASDAADEYREIFCVWRAPKEPTLTHVEKTLLYALK